MQGLGLGLYITRGLVEAHGGRITVESTPWIGSAFRIWFPAMSSRS
jgi:signal transduction histidine kinase